MQYEQTEGDEVEDLYNLLRRVKEEFPCVEGVVTGAVLSTYQRMRVEDVCLRLGLASIAYLWQRDQSELLQDMIDTGMEAIVVKIASMGLKMIHLGKTIARMQNHFEKLKADFDFHTAGEGGEYETLTLFHPQLFWKARIVIDEAETVMHEDFCFSPVAYLRIVKHHLEPIEGAEEPHWIHKPRPPSPTVSAPLCAALINAKFSNTRPLLENVTAHRG